MMQERVTDQQGAARSTAVAANTMFLVTSAVPVGDNPPSSSCSVDFKQQEKSKTNREAQIYHGAQCVSSTFLSEEGLTAPASSHLVGSSSNTYFEMMFRFKSHSSSFRLLIAVKTTDCRKQCLRTTVYKVHRTPDNKGKQAVTMATVLWFETVSTQFGFRHETIAGVRDGSGYRTSLCSSSSCHGCEASARNDLILQK